MISQIDLYIYLKRISDITNSICDIRNWNTDTSLIHLYEYDITIANSSCISDITDSVCDIINWMRDISKSIERSLFQTTISDISKSFSDITNRIGDISNSFRVISK